MPVVTRRRLSIGLCVVTLALVVPATYAIGDRSQAAPVARGPFPPKGTWEKRDPASLGLDPVALDAALKAVLATENPNNKDLAVDVPNTFRNEAPYNNLIGPT